MGWLPIIFALADGDITRSEWIRKKVPQLKLVQWLKIMIRRSEAIRQSYSDKPGKKVIRGKGGFAEKISQATGWQIERQKKNA